MGFYWTGTGFEERTAPPMPPPADSLATEPRQTAGFDGAIELPSSWPSAGSALQSSSQDAAPENAAQALEKHFSYQSEVRNAESRKKADDTGPMSFDPMQGVWTRADKNAALFPTPIVPPAMAAASSPQVKPGSDTGSFFKWTSWFRTDSEKGRVLVTPPSEEAPEAELPSEVASEVFSSAGAENVADLDAQVELAASEILAPAQPLTDTQDVTDLVAETATVDENAYLTAPWLADIQDQDVPEAQSAVDENVVLVAPSLETEKDKGESMWQIATNGREALLKESHSSEETPQAAHDGNASRWFVLKGMLGGALAPESSEPTGDAPMVEVFSLAGGVGKTSLVATLGRALSARGERVLLVDATPMPSLQYYFGACDSRPGALRTFRPPSSSADAPIRLATVDTEAQDSKSAPGMLAKEVQRWADGASRVIVDVGTGSVAAVRDLAKLAPLVLVPLVPDVNSVVTAKTIDSFFQRQIGASGNQPMVCYLLNQFDSSLPLHLDVRNVLREQLRERLLPFALERTPAVSEALAEGMTIMDYAPDSRITADFTNLADWLDKVLAPAKLESHGRWSER